VESEQDKQNSHNHDAGEGLENVMAGQLKKKNQARGSYESCHPQPIVVKIISN
jgi:hypothetical protein